MSRDNKVLLTMVPNVMTSSFLGLVGWFTPYPRMRWFGAACAIYVIWLWCDWLEASRLAPSRRQIEKGSTSGTTSRYRRNGPLHGV